MAGPDKDVPQAPGSPMHVDLAAVDLGMLGEALSGGDGDGEWLFDLRTGETGYRPSDLEEPEDGDDADDRVLVDPLPSHVRYQDMVDFTERLSDEQAARRLARTLGGKGAFRRWKDELHQQHEELVGSWNAFRDNRSDRRAVEWLLDNDLVADETYQRFVTEHPDPPVP